MRADFISLFAALELLLVPLLCLKERFLFLLRQNLESEVVAKKSVVFFLSEKQRSRIHPAVDRVTRSKVAF